MGKKINYAEYIRTKHGKLTIMSLLHKNNKTYCHCKCECGNEKDIAIYTVIDGRYRSCGCLEKSSRYNRKHSKDDVIGQRFGRLTVIRDIGLRCTNGSVNWECRCDCGNITYSDSSNLKRGHTTSCGCYKDDYIQSLKLDVIGKQIGFWTVLDDITTENDRCRMVKCQCICGNVKKVVLSDITSDHTMSCGCIKRSEGEMLIDAFLSEKEIEFIPQKRFSDCKNIRSLPFDFYLPEYNTCIEYQGAQHYQSVEYWGGDERLKYRQKNDKIKSDYCQSHNITLLCLPYTMKEEEIKQEILNALNP